MSERGEHDAIRVLRADPDLVAHLDPASARAAQRVAICPVVKLDRDAACRLAARGDADEATLAYLMLSGLLVHRVEVAGRSGIELLGRGDVLFSPARELASPQHAIQAREAWEVLHPARVAVLDREFERTAVKWPGIIPRIFDRAAQRVSTLRFHIALGQVAGIERRVLVLLWLLADRWGTVSPEGVNLPLRLSHRLLGELIAARRPSVTTALRALAEAGLIVPRQPAGWILRGDPPERLGAAPPTGDASRTRARPLLSAG